MSPFCAECWGRQARQRIQRDVFSTFIQLIRQDKNIHDCKPKTDTGRERENRIGSEISKTRKIVPVGKRIKIASWEKGLEG